VLTKIQIGLCILTGVGLVIFIAGILMNRDVTTVPGWLGPAAWGSFGLMVACCLGVVVTIALDRERPAKSKDEPGADGDEAEAKPPEGPLAEENVPDFEHEEPTQVEHGTEPTMIYQPGAASEHEGSGEEEEEPLFSADDSESFEIKPE
jgi:hypothetical protein